MNKATLISLAFGTLLATTAYANELVSPSPEGAKAYIISPQDGAEVTSPVTVKFGLSGMGVAPAGVDKANTGHHHLLINTDVKTLDLSAPLPASDTVKHFGGGQTETSLALEPGTYSLQLLLGNHLHIPHDKPVLSDPVTITVK